MSVKSARGIFVALWCLLLLVKLWLVASLPAFGDEAFYAQEARRLAWAYSDLPGLTAWLIRLGMEIGGPGLPALRMPFLLLAAAIPWLVVRIGARWFGAQAGWRAGCLVLVMPPFALLGVLALPDVPMLFAALCCLDATAVLLRDGPRRAALLQLAVALAIGAFAHYRFAAVIVAGAVGLACAPGGRALLRSPSLWLALLAGALAWWPLLAWNIEHDAAGVAFQFVERHPWRLQAEGFAWPLVQALLLTPPLFLLLLATLAKAWRWRTEPGWGLLAGTGAVATLGWFLLAFVADNERVSFHWPLAGWLALTSAAPGVLAGWPRWARFATWLLASLGTAALLAYAGAQTSSTLRARLAATPLWADEFSGWSEAADAVRAQLQAMPPETVLVADNFLLGAQLSLALGRDDIAVLPHPRNARHGRAAQLAVWGLATRGRADWNGAPVLLIVEDTARPLKHRLAGYFALCVATGLGASPRVLQVDHGRKRFLLWPLPGSAVGGHAATAAGSGATDGGCRMPALAWIDAPDPGQRVSGQLAIQGWAWRPGSALAGVEVLLDGRPLAAADYRLPRGDVLAYWGRAESGDSPEVGFRARVDLSGVPPGRHWLGLRLHGADGSVEDWPEQPIVVGR